MKEKIQKKLFHLWTGECVAAVMFVVLWVLYVPMFDWAADYLTPLPTIYAFSLLEFILLQGGLYWYLKWNHVRKNQNYKLSTDKLRIFSVFKRINLFLITIGLIILLVALYRSDIYRGFYAFLYGFAVVEYINYFHIRLSYMSIEELRELMKQKGFRQSILAKELTMYRKKL
ncbi:hypothetical protein [Aquibacillus kalidii]|uniref:hypothetical protein n=1 Tax=Aquibacillus kalidii TaxID=2762597 RepID=UPI00164796E4|nr:hypothetical protein [Aquibacillus kalidii]